MGEGKNALVFGGFLDMSVTVYEVCVVAVVVDLYYVVIKRPKDVIEITGLDDDPVDPCTCLTDLPMCARSRYVK